MSKLKPDWRGKATRPKKAEFRLAFLFAELEPSLVVHFCDKMWGVKGYDENKTGSLRMEKSCFNKIQSTLLKRGN